MAMKPMKSFVGGPEVVYDIDALELTLGTPLELWLGPEDGETAEQRAARRDAARDILMEEPELYDRVITLVAEAVGELIADLVATTPTTAPIVALHRDVLRAAEVAA